MANLLPESVKVSTDPKPTESRVANTIHRWIALTDLLTIISLTGIVAVSMIVLVLILIGYLDQWESIPSAVTYLQTGIAGLMLPVLSNALRLLGQRYVYAKLCGKGLPSRRIAIYSDCSVGNLTSTLFTDRTEPLVTILLLVWLLGLATSFTVRDSAKMAPLFVRGVPVALPVGPLDSNTFFSIQGSLAPITSATISSLASAIANRIEGTLGYINVTNAYVGSVYYPPLLPRATSSIGSFDAPARLNGLQVSLTSLESRPSSATYLECTQLAAGVASLWPGAGSPSIYLVEATTNVLSFAYPVSGKWTQVDSAAVILGGRLSVQTFAPRPYAQFRANGTTWPLNMRDTKWATELMDVLCNTTVVETPYSGGPILRLALGINQRDTLNLNPWATSNEMLWSTTMGTIMGAYSINKFNNPARSPFIYVDMDTERQALVPTYATCVLLASSLISLALLFAVCRLFNASPLDRDFMDPTRLLLSPLEERQLFNAPLDETMRHMNDPHVRVTRSQLLITRTKCDGDSMYDKT
ncbi:hypothetical protein FS842_010766 [Serendipita sp. 407]|nr:hypothetical protein FS842_010766 [Serendipita sp. 407]